MKEKTTNELDEMLKKTKPSQLEEYYKENNEYMVNADKEFTYYMKDVLASKNLKIGKRKMYYKDLYTLAGLSESYGEKVLNMTKHTKERDVIIRLCIVGRFQLEEINRALKLYGVAPLYAKDKRDACIIVAINNRKYDLLEIDEMLEKQGLDILSKEVDE